MSAEELQEKQDRTEPEPEHVFQAGILHYGLEDLLDSRLPLGHRFGLLHSKTDEVL